MKKPQVLPERDFWPINVRRLSRSQRKLRHTQSHAIQQSPDPENALSAINGFGIARERSVHLPPEPRDCGARLSRTWERTARCSTDAAFNVHLLALIVVERERRAPTSTFPPPAFVPLQTFAPTTGRKEAQWQANMAVDDIGLGLCGI